MRKLRRQRFITTFAAGHGYGSVNELALKDPPLFKEVLSCFRWTEKNMDLLIRALQKQSSEGEKIVAVAP